MNKTLLLITSLLVSPMAVAESKDRDICIMSSEVAEKIMRVRQKGVSLTDLMQSFSDPISKSGVVYEIILNAYETPIYYSDSARRNAIRDFKNFVAVECYRAFQDD